MWIIFSIFSKITNFIFPPTCFGCKNREEIICDNCLKKCSKSIETPFLYITSIYSFKDPLIKKAIHAIKYYHRVDLIEPLTKEISTIIQDERNKNHRNYDWVILPIPMPRLRKYIRGYNQAEITAKEISKKTGLICKNNLIIRSRSPKRQVKTSTRNERLVNQKNSFEIKEGVKGLNIILIDDVTTTGATINEARNVLLKNGANDVRAITIAH